MDTFLGFPEQYYVGKKYDPRKFAASQTVTPGRKKALECVSELEIMYDLRFKDSSEIIVFLVKIEKKDDDWTYSSVADAMASSIPHQCLVVIHDGYVANIFSFISRIQKNNPRRRKIYDAYRFIGFEMRRPEEEHKKVLKKMRKAIQQYDSAEMVCYEWNRIISEFWKNYKYTETFGYSIDKWLNKEQNDKYKRYEYELGESFEDYWIEHDFKVEDERTDRCEDKYWWWNKDE